jgi:hypothetical protein
MQPGVMGNQETRQGDMLAASQLQTRSRRERAERSVEIEPIG